MNEFGLAEPAFNAYLPWDRLRALARGEDLPEYTQGAGLFADISGFTPLSEALVRQLGAQRGAEEATRLLERIYDALIEAVHGLGGSVIGFMGDAIVCWFEGDAGARALACAVRMQGAMVEFARIVVTEAVTVALTLKIGGACGAARRMVVGAPGEQVFDALAGRTVELMFQAESQAVRGEIVLAEELVWALAATVSVREWRTHPDSGARFAVVGSVESAEMAMDARAVPTAVNPAAEIVPDIPGTPDTAGRAAAGDAAAGDAIAWERLRPWIAPAVHTYMQRQDARFHAELRTVTALFILFEPINYATDPAAGRILDACVRWVQRVAGRYGGTLIDLTTHEANAVVYVVFGAPVAHDEDCLHAVQAALELVVVPEALEGVQARVGMTVGLVRTGTFGGRWRRAYGALGDSVNLAWRLMEITPPGQVRCDYQVYRRVFKQSAFEVLPAVRLKGKAGLVRVYAPTGKRLVGMVSAGALVGRAVEQARLQAALAAVQAGAAQALIFEGEAGIGKSRMLAELVRQARGRGLAGVIGNGYSIEQHTPYRAWRDVFSVCFGIEGVEALSEQRRLVQTVLMHSVPQHAERWALLNDILDLQFADSELTARLSGELRRQNLAWLLCDLLKAWARARPLVLLFEDAHWLDGLTWELLLQSVRALRAAGSGFLLVLATRPLEVASVGERSLRTLHELVACETLVLGALDEASMAVLLAQRLQSAPELIPPEIVRFIHMRAHGNPFFAEEIVLALHERGALVVGADQRVRGPEIEQAALALPDTLHGLILARVDRLSAELQLVIKVAAVIGRVFGLALLRHVLEQLGAAALERLDEHLAHLQTADFTFVEAVEPERTYAFKHIITQEVAYQTLLFEQRRVLHRSVAAWYAQAPQPFSGVVLALLVYHYGAAEEWEHERRYARLAGEAADAHFANRDAVRYYTRALELTPVDAVQERLALLLARERLYGLQGARELQEADLRAVERVAEELQDARIQAVVALRRAVYAEAVSDFPGAVVAAARAVGMAERVPDVGLQIDGLVRGGQAWTLQTRLEEARVLLERALALARAAGARAGEAEVQYVLADTLRIQGRVQEALGGMQMALHICRELHYLEGEARALHLTGYLHEQLDEHDAARRAYEQALLMRRAVGDRRGEASTLQRLGVVARHLGEHDTAERYYLQVLPILREIDDRMTLGVALINLEVLYSDLGDYASALRLITEAHALMQAVGNRRGVAIALNNLGDIWLYQGDYARALEYHLQSLVLMRAIGDRRSEGYLLTSIGLVHFERGALAEAEACYREAIALRQALGQAYLEMESWAALAQVTLAQGAVAEAHAQVARVLAFLDQGGVVSGMDRPLLVYLHCYRVLRAAGSARAGAVLARAYAQLAAQAARIGRLELRRTFMENVPWHRALQALYIDSL